MTTILKANPKLRLDKLALFRQLGYEPHPGQLAVHVSTAPRRVLACGVRWGKSVCASMEAVAAAMSAAEQSLGWIVAPSYALTDIIFQAVRMTIEAKLAHRIVRIENRERLIVLRNLSGGLSEVRGKSAENPSNLLGAGLNWLVVDEAAALREDVWQSYLGGRLVDRKGWALLVSTPRGRGWYYDVFCRGLHGRDPTFESFTQPSWANPLLDRTAIELERTRVSEEVFLQEYSAEFIGALGRVCSTCGAPERCGPGCIALFEGETVSECSECHNPIDENGAPLGRANDDGEVLLQIIRLAGVKRPAGWPMPEPAPQNSEPPQTAVPA